MIILSAGVVLGPLRTTTADFLIFFFMNPSLSLFLVCVFLFILLGAALYFLSVGRGLAKRAGGRSGNLRVAVHSRCVRVWVAGGRFHSLSESKRY